MDPFDLNWDPLDVGSNTDGPSGSMNSCKAINGSDELSDETDDSEDLILPPLPDPDTQLVSQKRDLDEWLASSSDAPFFSSDDLLASSSDLYLDEHRRKRQHRGPWYNEEQVSIKSTTQGSPPQKARHKSPLQRNMDSGVWLPSNESTGGEESRRNEESTGNEELTGYEELTDYEELTGYEESTGGEGSTSSEDAEYSRKLAVRKARIVMDMGGFTDDVDDNKGAANPPWSIDVLGRASKIEDKFAAMYHKATQVTEDQEYFEGLVFPYVSVTSLVT